MPNSNAKGLPLIGLVGALVFMCMTNLAARSADPLGKKVATAALWYLENKGPLQRRDCSGLVTAILARAGIEVQGNSETFWKAAERDGRLSKRVRPGDLAIFDRTYDRNKNGRVDDVFTHVAVVVRIDAHDTVHMVHFGSRRIMALRLNQKKPGIRGIGNIQYNDYLRAPGYGRADGARLSGQLLRGFIRPPRGP